MIRNARHVLHSTPWLLLAALTLSACSTRVSAPPEPPRSVRRGDEAFRFREYDAAITAYRAYIDQTDDGDYIARVLYKTALSEYRLGRYEKALKTLDELEKHYPGAHWVQVDALRGDAEQALGERMTALQTWDAGWKVAGDNDRQKLRQRIVNIARGLNDVELARARRMVHEHEVAVLLDKQIALRQPPALNEPMPDSGEESDEGATAHAEAPQALSEAEREAAATDADDEFSAPAEEPPAHAIAAAPARVAPVVPVAPAPPLAPVAPAAPLVLPAPNDELKISGTAKIGCLLPLSGSSREYGERSLRGIRLVFNEKKDRLVIKDAGADAAAAVAAWSELVRDPSVVAVIGPLRSEDAEAVAPLAEQAHLPLLLLSQRDGLDSRYALQVGMTRARLVNTLLDYAMDKVRMRRFGVLYPEDTYGKEFMTTFRAAAERRGGTVVGTDAYAPETHGIGVGTVRKWRDTQQVQAVFLPDNATIAGNLARYLQSEMPDVTLLGVHGWESLASHEDSGNLSGILFTDGFYASSARPATRDFVAHFQRVYSDMPGTLEAQAYDAALLAKEAVDGGARSRADLVRQLQALGVVEGATGQLHITPGGVERSLFLLQVYDGKLQEIGTAG